VAAVLGSPSSSLPAALRAALLRALLILLVVPSAVAHAQWLSVTHEPPPAPPEPLATITDVHGLSSFGLFAAGALTGFLAHESGHVFANLVQGNVPRFEGILGFGFVPFFTVAPRIDCEQGHCVKHDGSAFSNGLPGKIAITSAGFNVQHLTDEILLTRNPRLRQRVAPYRKGLFAFNTLLSLAYATTCITRTENSTGDVTASARLMGVPRELYALSLATLAGLDLYRYFVPDGRVAPWLSRGGKVLFVGVLFTL